MLFSDAGIVSPEEGMRLETENFRRSDDSLLIYTRDRPTVSLGRFNETERYVDTDYAEEHSVTMIRRASGGSAVFTDSGQVIYSFSAPRDAFADKTESYKAVCGAVIGTLAHLGVKAEFKPVNDVLADGRKISGCAQYRDRDRVLLHGTLILRLDQRTMDSVLRPVKERKYGGLTSVEEMTGKMPKREEIAKAFEEGFRDLI